MRFRRLLHGLRTLSGIAPLVLLLATACATNEPLPDGDAGDMDGAIDENRVDAGPNPPNSGPCGAAGNSCCAGRICELGLGCGAGDVCCLQAGGGQRCEGAGDCCRGLACDDNVCCAPRNASCSGASDCCGGLLCSEGTCQAPGDVDPTNPDCGALGMTCCAGFTCQAGHVCNSGTCEACGDEGQGCCDGATGCVGSLGCDIDTTASPPTATCVNAGDPATACGNIDRPCCPNDECEGPSTANPAGLVCVGGMCLQPDDVGFDGAPCGPSGTCDAGLVCDRRTEPMGICTTPPDGCGTDGTMCCDLGGSEGECAGALHCQFGDCTTCRGPSLTCLLGGILPGQECCNGSVCRPSPLVPRCCLGQGEECSGSIDCCGLMGCSGGTCMCGGDGSFCITSSECCDGLSCNFFQCREAEECVEAGAACDAGSQCCDGLTCSDARGPDEETAESACCSGAETSCTEHEDCCGRMQCSDEGECECLGRGSRCDRDVECCEGDICLAGSCTDGQGCEREGMACTLEGGCCGQLICDPALSSGDMTCCVGRGVQCRRSSDCCGNMTCDQETELCVGVASGSPCDHFNGCEDGLSCLETSSGSGSYTCQTPPT